MRTAKGLLAFTLIIAAASLLAIAVAAAEHPAGVPADFAERPAGASRNRFGAASSIGPDIGAQQPITPTRPISPPPAAVDLPLTQLPSPVAPSALPSLRAVVMVGPIDPPGNEWTNAQIADMERAAEALERHGVAVSRFYHPYANWGQIRTAAEGANFLFYKGHGVYWSPFPTPTVGGFSLSDGFVSPDEIRNELHLASGAIVMIYGCFAAGSSGIDPGPISTVEAQRRVAQYADPFIDIGVGAYFSNVWDKSFAAYVDAAFAGHTMGNVFRDFWAFDIRTFEGYAYADRRGYSLWLDPWHDPSYFARWNQAFVGDRLATLEDLATPPTLHLSRDSLVFVSLPEGHPVGQSVEVSKSGWWGHRFSWTAVPTPTGWLAVVPSSGNYARSLVSVTVDTSGLASGRHQGQITVTAPQARASPQTISVRLVIVEHVHERHLPLAQNSYSSHWGAL